MGSKSQGLVAAPTDPNNQAQLSNQGLNSSFINQANTGVAGPSNTGPMTYNANPVSSGGLSGFGGFGPTYGQMGNAYKNTMGGVTSGMTSMIGAMKDQQQNPNGTAMLDAAKNLPGQLTPKLGSGKGGQGSGLNKNIRF